MKVLHAELLVVASRPEEFPRAELAEVAFLGRSNVGKSSLLNRLVNRKQLARTSTTPGKTRLVHWYRVERAVGALCFVDLPGYGYAKVGQDERRRWKRLVEAYLEGRPALRAAVLLQDLRRDAADDERLLLEWLAERRIPALVALTKADKLPLGPRGVRARALARAFALPPERVLTTSAERGLGIPELWRAIDAELRAGSSAA
ncbi:MAG TPA: ribosome biogenesis GTP-binding protein YihA/YsxC [Myxococcota bacterium]|nr:ribosome biogenesis GTP-binding protein YihA/YsxC [Myxococcota bacterium]